jgi:hypothetical protein
MTNIRSAFAEIVSRQHVALPASLLKPQSGAFSSSNDRLPSSASGTREEDLRQALDTAIGSLHALGSLYKRREMRWIEEKHRLDEEKERALLLFKQVLGAGVFGNIAEGARQRRWPTYCRRVLTSLLLLLLVFWPCLSQLRFAGRVALRHCVVG